MLVYTIFVVIIIYLFRDLEVQRQELFSSFKSFIPRPAVQIISIGDTNKQKGDYTNTNTQFQLDPSFKRIQDTSIIDKINKRLGNILQKEIMRLLKENISVEYLELYRSLYDIYWNENDFFVKVNITDTSSIKLRALLVKFFIKHENFQFDTGTLKINFIKEIVNEINIVPYNNDTYNNTPNGSALFEISNTLGLVHGNWSIIPKT